jgi:hypothetical protein
MGDLDRVQVYALDIFDEGSACGYGIGIVAHHHRYRG